MFLCSKKGSNLIYFYCSGLRAYSDPVIFRDDRVLRTLLSKETKYVPLASNYFEFQKDLKPHMRKEVANWMLEVCEAEDCQPEIFCLAMNYMDRFLSYVKIGQNQLQLLGSVCLLVACKVRQHSPLPASKLIEYSDFNLDLNDIMVSTKSARAIFYYFKRTALQRRLKNKKKTDLFQMADWFMLDSRIRN